MPHSPNTGVCSSRRIKLTLIFDIFRIGVVTGFREGTLSLFNLFSLKRLPLLSQFHIMLFYVLLFHVLQFHALHTGPSISRPAFSAPPYGLWMQGFKNSQSKLVSRCPRLYGATLS